MKRLAPLALIAAAIAWPQAASAQKAQYQNKTEYDSLVAHHARINNVPESLVHRVIVRESKYQPRLIGRGGAMGMMQIKLPTARGVGYTGTAEGLLDAETNVTYAVRYLAGAWRLANGSHDQAVSHYARGYYYAAKRAGMLGHARANRHSKGPQQLVAHVSMRPGKSSKDFSLPPREDELTSLRAEVSR